MTDPDQTCVTAEDLYTLEYQIDADGVARWTGRVVPLPALVTKAPGPTVAELVKILADPILDEPEYRP